MKNTDYATEIWRPVKDYEKLYMVSNLGRVKSLDRVAKDGRVFYGMIRKLRTDKHGYLYVGLTKNRKQVMKKVHRLVAESFLENPLNKKTVNHINGIKSDNNVVNLEWATMSENSLHAYRESLKRGAYGRKNANSKVDEEKVVEIRKRHRQGEKQSNIAESYGISSGQVSAIVNGVCWNHVDWGIR